MTYNSTEYNRKWRSDNPEKDKITCLLRSAKARAIKADVPFALTRADIPPIPDYCPILGIKLKYQQGRFHDNAASLDRIKPKLGYVPGNVHWISYRANAIKRDATPDELMSVATYFTNLEATNNA